VAEAVQIEAPLEWDTPLYRQALTQFELALPHAGVATAVVERQRFPERSLMVSIPVRVDTGEYRCFAGVAWAGLRTLRHTRASILFRRG
jgi:hypothetical protein